ncbi:tripartite tricarboxylate transporter substrate binding protein [Ideonella sp. DXS22W]|uniref:Tripartite tricarboxylate transporter substrate binding protein n=1 Tax=Pseudaquabacterium inlustre TaxID=2984192 RepID=A0ABU9CLC0_9BURK
MTHRPCAPSSPSIAAPARRRLLRGLALTAATVGGAAALPALAADAWPSKPIQIVVPFPAGGATDVMGRLFAKALGEKLGQTVVVENRGGAGTVIGAAYAAKAPADGYTLLISSGTTFTVNPAINPKLPYDPVKSFEPIGLVGRTPLILLAHPDVKASSPKTFAALVKPAPGKFTWASFGQGTTSQFTGELLQRATETQMLHVPYKGSAPAMTDLMAGQVQFSVDTVTAAIPQLKAGKVKAIGVTTAKRSALLPDVPSFQEQGYALNADTWLAFVAPRGLPPAVRAKLEKTLQELVATPDIREKMLANGMEPGFLNGAQLGQLIENELPIMRATAARANIKAE